MTDQPDYAELLEAASTIGTERYFTLATSTFELVQELATALRTTLADRDALRRELEAARWALSFAASVIKSGEPWTTTCDEVFGKALAARTASEKEERDGD